VPSKNYGARFLTDNGLIDKTCSSVWKWPKNVYRAALDRDSIVPTPAHFEPNKQTVGGTVGVCVVGESGLDENRQKGNEDANGGYRNTTIERETLGAGVYHSGEVGFSSQRSTTDRSIDSCPLPPPHPASSAAARYNLLLPVRILGERTLLSGPPYTSFSLNAPKQSFVGDKGSSSISFANYCYDRPV
jgi:hypothetical protein